MPNYSCIACSEVIPEQKARIHCDICPNFDLCANCYVVGAQAGNHASYHPTTLVKVSGVMSPSMNPPLPPRRPVPSPSQPPSAQVNTPPQRSQYTQQYNNTTPTYPQSSFQSSSALPSPSEPPQNFSAGLRWQILFNGTQPTPEFIALMDAIFQHLDIGRTGYLTPEVYSSFLDVQGYMIEQNVWKKSLSATFGQTKEDMADYEWKSSLDNFSIEHIMVPRSQQPNNDMDNLANSFGGLLNNNLRNIISSTQPRSVSGGQMPLMTRKGFIDITTIEVLYDPSTSWNNLKRALATYGIWVERGPMPRDVLPAYPPPAILERVQRISELAMYKAQTAINAKHAESKLRLKGQQAALDLLDPPVRYYHY